MERNFFSSGTNDLTQTALGISRDDYVKFSKAYEDLKIFKADPFAVLDQEGVGKLVDMGIKLGRQTRPDLEVGICGEHGGEPSSVEFCYPVGMGYVSCSPYRVPIARLAAAQAGSYTRKVRGTPPAALGCFELQIEEPSELVGWRCGVILRTMVELFVSPYLRELGYGTQPSLIELSTRAVVRVAGGMGVLGPWAEWRGFCDYLACVEMAREAIHALPRDGAIGGSLAIPAKYHSVALVFLAQALLDNIANWLCSQLCPKVGGKERVFTSRRFRRELSRVTGAAAFFSTHQGFIERLDRYRQVWIHNLSGGGGLYSDRPPNEPGAAVLIAVPMDPAINPYAADDPGYLKRIQDCMKDNNGRWLCPVTEFADWVRDGIRQAFLDILELSLKALPPAPGP